MALASLSQHMSLPAIYSRMVATRHWQHAYARYGGKVSMQSDPKHQYVLIHNQSNGKTDHMSLLSHVAHHV
jgi:hypothetical protein